MKKLFAVLAAMLLLVTMACSSGGDDGGNTTKPKTYSITGQITSNSTGLAGVTVSLSGASAAQTTTDSSGNYNFTGQSNGDYTVSPSLSGYVFSPSGTVVTISHTDKAGIDFTATASTTPTYSISGTVSGAVQLGVTISLAGTSSGSTLTDSSGNYSFNGVANGNYTITASKTGYTFSPVRSITVNGANITGQNFTATASTTPTYSISGTVSGAVQLGITVTLTGTGSVSTTTDSSGNYSFSGAANGSYTITASKTGYTFSPVRSITVNGANITGQNFTATANVVPSSAKAITAFSLAGVVGTINETGKTIAITMPSGTSVTALVATFTTTGASVAVGSIVQVSGTTPNNFTSSVTYTVTAADSSTQDYTVTVATDYTSTNIGTLKYVPAGSFQRDSTSTNISTVSAFRMSQYDITRAQFLAIMGTDPSNTTYSSGTSDPVQQASWRQAIAFCNKLSIAEGLTPVYSVSGVNFTTLTYAAIPTIAVAGNTTWDAATANWSANGYRLPTEMEWMWAAMGATSDGRGADIVGGVNTGGYTKGYAGSIEAGGAQVNIGNYAWTSENSANTTHPVGTKLPNELGLYDMSGNVFGWCWDWVAYNGAYPYYAITGAVTDYRGAASGDCRVLRGGSWNLIASYATVAFRNADNPWPQYDYFGFRVVRP
jgi:formylglycine-generating enzyme required for sulfatase activity